MTPYLIRRTTKHLTRIHDIAPDGKRPNCHRANLVAGERGWKIEEYKPAWDELCWHCWAKREKDKK